MTFSFASAHEIQVVRQSLLGSTEAERLTCQGEHFLLPVEDLVDSRAQQFSVIEHGWTPTDERGTPLTPSFVSVRDGTLDLEGYRQIETQYCHLLRCVHSVAPDKCFVQVSYNLSPDAEQAIGYYFDSSDVDTITYLLNELRRESRDIISVPDIETVELLMKTGMREIAMSTFAFPTLGLSLINHWDMRLLAYSVTPMASDLLARSVIMSGLRIRSLRS